MLTAVMSGVFKKSHFQLQTDTQIRDKIINSQHANHLQVTHNITELE